jgi:hypothetical protein
LLTFLHASTFLGQVLNLSSIFYVVLWGTLIWEPESWNSRKCSTERHRTAISHFWEAVHMKLYSMNRKRVIFIVLIHVRYWLHHLEHHLESILKSCQFKFYKYKCTVWKLFAVVRQCMLQKAVLCLEVTAHVLFSTIRRTGNACITLVLRVLYEHLAGVMLLNA